MSQSLRPLAKPVERRWDPELSDPTTALGYFLPFHRLWLVGPRQQLLADRLPVFRQVLRQFVHGQSIDAGLPLFCLTRFSAALALPRSTTSSMR